MPEIKILIVDDEKPARKKIRSFLRKEGIDTFHEAENGLKAVKFILEEKPDLVFLDIQMPGMNGFEVVDTIGTDEMPAVIFVTAYDQYAIEAFEVQAIDYLLKPYDNERFRKSFYRALERINLKNENVTALTKLIEEFNRGEKYLNRIIVNKGSRFFFIKTGDIELISSDEKYVKLHTKQGEYLIRSSMNRIERKLDPQNFSRIHRSYIVNVDLIKEMQPRSHGDYLVILKNGKKLNVSRRYREQLFGRI